MILYELSMIIQKKAFLPHDNVVLYAPGRNSEKFNLGPIEGSRSRMVEDAAFTFQMYTTRTVPFLADTT